MALRRLRLLLVSRGKICGEWGEQRTVLRSLVMRNSECDEALGQRFHENWLTVFSIAGNKILRILKSSGMRISWNCSSLHNNPA